MGRSSRKATSTDEAMRTWVKQKDMFPNASFFLKGFLATPPARTAFQIIQCMQQMQQMQQSEQMQLMQQHADGSPPTLGSTPEVGDATPIPAGASPEDVFLRVCERCHK